MDDQLRSARKRGVTHGIHIADDDIPRLQGELNGILGWVEQLAALDVEGVQPLTGAARMALRLRDDAVTEGGIPEKILANAPERAGDYFVVPKVVE